MDACGMQKSNLECPSIKQGAFSVCNFTFSALSYFKKGALIEVQPSDTDARF